MTDSQPARGCDLKFCPFCGSGSAEVIFNDDPMGTGPFHYVKCHGCDAETGPEQSGHDAADAWNMRSAPWNTRVAGGGGVSDAMVERLTIRFFNQTLGIPSWSKTKEGDRQMALQSMRELIGELVAALQVKP